MSNTLLLSRTDYRGSRPFLFPKHPFPDDSGSGPSANESLFLTRPAHAPPTPHVQRLPVLDGWRGISILLVLLGHMVPLGPKWLALNSMVSAAGLSIFFFLSGFLVISMLNSSQNVLSFLIKRLFRIVPLAWLVIALLVVINYQTTDIFITNVLFFANVFPATLMRSGEHLWSLSVEVQFYLAVATSVVVFGRPALFVIPLACAAVTCYRISQGSGFSIITWLRVDEILVGGTVALFVPRSTQAGASVGWPIALVFLLVPLVFICCHEGFKVANYMRPYAVAILVYSSMNCNSYTLSRILTARVLFYLAELSYALYLIHPLTYSGWLGEGDTFVRYSKRVLSLMITFTFAHFLCRHFEQPFSRFGRQLAKSYESHYRPLHSPTNRTLSRQTSPEHVGA